jgi:predicted phage terminase large subunit-like protein
MTTDLQLLRIIGLPSLIGQHIGMEVWGEPYVIFPWIEYMEQRIIEAIMDTSHERYIMIAAPPQTGKSSYVGTLLPFWLTGMFPQKQTMYIGYSDEFATIRGKDVQDLHRVYGRRMFDSQIDPRFQAGSDWRLKGSKGGMLCAGIGGGITGRPGHIIVIDDLIKKGEEAASKATLDKHVDEWDRTISTRLQPGGTVILMATRWAEGDLQGVLKERMAEPDYMGPQWEMLEFPAFAEPPEDMDLTEDELKEWRDVLGRKHGEVLDCRYSRIPGREPDDYYKLKRSSTDIYAWSSMYQQHPSVREGGLFPKENWVYEPMDSWPQMFETVRVWDMAATEGAGDFTVGTKIGRGADGRFYVMDVQRFRRGPGEVEKAVIRQAELDGFLTRIMIEEEKGGAGKSTIDAYQRLLPGRRVDAAKAEGQKVTRAMPYASQQNQHRVVLPPAGSVSWSVKDFVDEHAKLMPDGRGPRNDDQIDTAAYGVASLIDAGGVDLWIPAQGVDGLRPEEQMDRLIAQPVVSGRRFARSPGGGPEGAGADVDGVEDDEPSTVWPGAVEAA